MYRKDVMCWCFLGMGDWRLRRECARVKWLVGLFVIDALMWIHFGQVAQRPQCFRMIQSYRCLPHNTCQTCTGSEPLKAYSK